MTQGTLLLSLLEAPLAFLFLEGAQLFAMHCVAEQVESLLVESLLFNRNQNEVLFPANEAGSLALFLVLAVRAEVLLLLALVLQVQAFLMHSQATFGAVHHHVVARGFAGEAQDAVCLDEVLGWMRDSLEQFRGCLFEETLGVHHFLALIFRVQKEGVDFALDFNKLLEVVVESPQQRHELEELQHLLHFGHFLFELLAFDSLFMHSLLGLCSHFVLEGLVSEDSVREDLGEGFVVESFGPQGFEEVGGAQGNLLNSEQMGDFVL